MVVCSEVCFCQGIWGVLDSTKSGHTDKIRCSLMGYWHVLEDNLEEHKLKHPGNMDGKIRCSGKDFHILLGKHGIPLGFLLASLENDTFIVHP